MARTRIRAVSAVTTVPFTLQDARSEPCHPPSTAPPPISSRPAAASLLEELEATPRSADKRPATGKRLTVLEVEVLRLFAEGLSDREVAARLDLSEHTVPRHVTNILTKTGLPSRAAAVAYAAKAGML